MFNVANGDKSKLVTISHDFENHLGKHVKIQIDSKGKILRCLVNEQERSPFSKTNVFQQLEVSNFNENAPHKRLKMMSPKYLRASSGN